MRKLLRHRPQRLQPPVRIKNVVFRIVGSKRLSGVRRAFGGSSRALLKPLPGARSKGLQLLFQQLMIGREILIDLKRTPQRNNRNQIRPRHLCVNIVLSRSDCPINLIRLHGRGIKEQNNQPSIFILIRSSRARRRCRKCGAGALARVPPDILPGLRHTLIRDGIDILNIK